MRISDWSSDVCSSDLPQPLPVFHHVGVYAYRPEALAHYTHWGEGSLEAHEGLEQLRFLENGEKILCVEVEARGRSFWESNNTVDVARTEAVFCSLRNVLGKASCRERVGLYV